MEQIPVRILHVIGSMNRGGAENMIMNLYRHVDRSKVQFDFVENTDKEAAFDSEIRELGGRIFRCPHYNVKNHVQYVRWWKQFLSDHADEYTAVHGHLGSTAAIYLSAAKKHGLFTIAHSHNTYDKHSSLKETVYKFYSYPTRYIADWFFACSKAAGLSRYGSKVSKSDRCLVLNNAIDTKRFSFCERKRIRIREELHISPEAFVIGHIGRFTQQKNHHFLLNTFSEIIKLYSDAVLLLVGGGELEQQIKAQAAELGIIDHVIFAGVQSDVSGYYQAMDVFVFPSLYEGLGIVAVEAQAAGLPCVISERVPLECAVTEGLVSVQGLDTSAEAWAERILSLSGTSRADHSQEVSANGYDISATAAWLQDFYLGIGGHQ